MLRTITYTLCLAIFLLGNLKAQSDSQSDKSKEARRQGILDEINEGAPAWAGVYSVTSIDVVVEYCIAPKAGIAMSFQYGDKISIKNVGRVLSFSGGRLQLAWEDPATEPSDMCLVKQEELLVLIPTGDIHRFFLRVQDDPQSARRYPCRSFELASAHQDLPELAPELKFVQSSRPLYGKVIGVQSLKVERLKQDMTEMPRGRKRQFRLEQRLSIDLGTNSGIFEGLVLYPAVAGGSLPIRITSVNDDCSVGEIQEVVRSANYIIREGDLLTTGEVGF